MQINVTKGTLKNLKAMSLRGRNDRSNLSLGLRIGDCFTTVRYSGWVFKDARNYVDFAFFDFSSKRSVMAKDTKAMFLLKQKERIGIPSHRYYFRLLEIRFSGVVEHFISSYRSTILGTKICLPEKIIEFLELT